MIWNRRLILILLLFFTLQAYAQRFDTGVAAVYVDDITKFGQNTRFYVNTNDHRFCLGPEFSWFQEDSKMVGGEELQRNLQEFNFNGHMNIQFVGPLMYYPLIGLNYSVEKEDYVHNGQVEESETLKEWGFNLGSGLHYNLGKDWILFAEYDHLFSKLSQNTLTFGILVGFGKIKGGHHENDGH